MVVGMSTATNHFRSSGTSASHRRHTDSCLQPLEEVESASLPTYERVIHVHLKSLQARHDRRLRRSHDVVSPGGRLQLPLTNKQDLLGRGGGEPISDGQVRVCLVTAWGE